MPDELPVAVPTRDYIILARDDDRVESPPGTQPETL
jgi:hypothetical protein